MPPVSKRYFGKFCSTHPELKGERYKSNSACIACSKIRARPAKVKYMIKRKVQDKEAVFHHYGNKCKKCGIGDPDVLTIDHTKQDGAEHRRQMGSLSSHQIYRWLVRNNFPKGFRILCANCNIKTYKTHMRQKGVYKS
jgi:hypothetical protein